jgi:hypothetical protein
MYQQPIFYKSKRKLSYSKKKEILIEAKILSYNCRVDIKRYPSWSREITDITFEEVMKLLKKENHFTIIHRFDVTGERYLEIGFVATDEKNDDYFLWLYLDEKHVNHFIEKYKLVVL